MIRFPCICGQVYEVPEDQAGTSFQCTHCGRLVDVPPLNDLAHIQADGTYDIDETNVQPPESAALDEMMLAYSREKVDRFGNEKDMRNTEADFAGLGQPEMLEFADDQQPPGVAVAMCTSQPASRRRMSVPAQRISASSGWARKLRATLRKAAAFYRRGRASHSRAQTDI